MSDSKSASEKKKKLRTSCVGVHFRDLIIAAQNLDLGLGLVPMLT